MEFDLDVETREFEDYIQRIAQDMEPEVLKRTLVNKAFQFVRVAVKWTPKDTGRAAGGWTPWTAHQGKEVGVAGPKVEQGEVRVGASEGSWDEKLRGRDQYVEITNGVPYIVQLEYGHSQQASGAARIAMRAVDARLDAEGAKNLEKLIRDADKKSSRLRGR